MKKFTRIISALLTAIMLIGTLVGVVVIDTSATNAGGETASIQDTLKGYLTTEYKTPEEKLATMTLKLESNGYQLWADEMSGEVATVDLATGEILFTNPYDIASSSGTASTKEKLMSQIHIRYVDNDVQKDFYSFVEAAYRGQIKVKNIKNGIRVEYTIGREETRMLVPRIIEKEAFETKILANIKAELGDGTWAYHKFADFFQLQDPSTVTSETLKAAMYSTYPITKKMAVYTLGSDASETDIRKLEETIKTYCPAYTYEELDIDHAKTEYTGADRAPALFKMALEYTIDADGMSVRLPANGIRFDESTYKLEYISILPYIGAGANYAGSDKNKTQTGYTFYPDGSGSIFRFEELADKGTTNISGKVYGPDFAYHTIVGAHQEIIRYPAIGLVSDEKIASADGLSESDVSRGFLAVIEEGDSMAELYTYHAGSLSKYNAVHMMFYPRPKDTYNMKDSLSVGTNASWQVVSPRKYVGNYKIRYFMLADPDKAAEKGATEYHEASWLGMAVAYREYLAKNGVLERLTGDAAKQDIPLYIETFGTLETIEKFLSIPINTSVALTSFSDIAEMYDELAELGIDNINFKLTGYANGGMYSTIPYKLKWEKAAGGANGFRDLVSYAKEKDFGVYPDFDFAYVQVSKNFDGMNAKKHLIKTIDDRYTSKREYDATYQTFVSYWSLAISPAYYSHFYEKLSANYAKYDSPSISVGTLGSDLNSDFDEDEPYNREDSKEFTVNALKYFDENYENVMVNGGNAYTWKYVDHILGVSLDSSRYNKSSNSVPFIGVLLHGYIQFAGNALNMEGNIGYAMLRTIENGASPYFILSKENTTLLKEDVYLSKYYSVRYDIWRQELVEIYNELNEVLADVQTKLIIDHDFLIGERVPDADELEADIKAAEEALREQLAAADKKGSEDAAQAILDARLTAKNNAAEIEALLKSIPATLDAAIKSIDNIAKARAALAANAADADAQKAYDDAVAAGVAAAKTAKEAAEQAASMAVAAREAATIVAAEASATDAIKQAALAQAASAETNGAEVVRQATLAVDYAALAVVFNSQNTVDALLNTANNALTSVNTSAGTVATRLENIKAAEEELIAAQKVAADAGANYDKAHELYLKAAEAAAVEGATDELKKAASDAYAAMKTAETEYKNVQVTVGTATTAFNSARVQLETAVKKAYDDKLKAVKAAEDAAAQIEDIKSALDTVKSAGAELKNAGLTTELANAAIAVYNAASAAAAEIANIGKSAEDSYAATAESVKKYVVINEDNNQDDNNDKTDSTDYTYTKYTEDGGNIVMVTYGDEVENSKYVPYKTFILNYNFFAVTVVVDNVTYTIPATGYVVFYHK